MSVLNLKGKWAADAGSDMVEVLEHKEVLGYIQKYFDYLEHSGYVREKVTDSYMLYLFLVDFVDLFYLYLTDADYAEIEKLLVEQFSAGYCLLPYPRFCSKCVTVGDPVKTGTHLRRSETEGLRKTENENLRGA